MFHVKIQFSSLLLRNSKFKAPILLSILGHFNIRIRFYVQRIIYTVRSGNLNIKNAAESKQETSETTEVLRWALTMKLAGCACLRYERERNKTFFILKTSASQLTIGKKVFSISWYHRNFVWKLHEYHVIFVKI